jgi:hypothetical protein
MLILHHDPATSSLQPYTKPRKALIHSRRKISKQFKKIQELQENSIFLLFFERAINPSKGLRKLNPDSVLRQTEKNPRTRL